MMSAGVHRLVVVGVAACWGTVAAVWIAGAIYNASRGPRAGRRAPAVTRLPILIVVLAAWLLFRLIPGADWHSLTVDWVTMSKVCFPVPLPTSAPYSGAWSSGIT